MSSPANRREKRAPGAGPRAVPQSRRAGGGPGRGRPNEARRRRGPVKGRGRGRAAASRDKHSAVAAGLRAPGSVLSHRCPSWLASAAAPRCSRPAARGHGEAARRVQDGDSRRDEHPAAAGGGRLPGAAGERCTAGCGPGGRPLGWLGRGPAASANPRARAPKAERGGRRAAGTFHTCSEPRASTPGKSRHCSQNSACLRSPGVPDSDRQTDAGTGCQMLWAHLLTGPLGFLEAEHGYASMLPYSSKDRDAFKRRNKPKKNSTSSR